ncbi:Glyoxalase/bleomycin resistance protein/dioxygenase [Pseudopedobacter saltans DSM 12145]|uniref:Glyoxalase/bleomycin resistance protein/dioxygenase n=1 Tax=Pseudopedobacter saltans (strain ATCC 51119 / DSM 12145 / JCM 21818 / CCUG 39354 / LMG 10337 / NBRC 100064 / NCIMB 13643) TaxID=762903 RepID=F0SE22_PSESL|nr:VOC family protein [Pseudopedobacter saltans]ADY52948.1 Glyoxalase/bleomycin resistance protein/dioxygenase [Pseudopedobacter saltans DSM 12145]
MNNNIICWFEIYIDDIDRAKKFYTEVLGTQFQDAPAIPGSGDLKMSFFSSAENQGVSGALVQNGESHNRNKGSLSTIVYFPCVDCSVEEARVKKAGGEVTTPKMSLGEHGFCSICIDTEGNTFGLYSLN